MASFSGNGHRRGLSVAIVGAGFGGIGMGLRLKQGGVEEFTIFERADSIGGVWRANTYPGAACDVPSHLYSFSFAPGVDWSKRYAPQHEILDYLQGCVERFGLEENLRLSAEVTEASFDPDVGRWTVVAEGEEHEFDFLVTACGQLTNPSIPVTPGREEFAGHSFHSSRWDHGHDLRGRRVAVIGTGASALQLVPEIAPLPEQLTIYQRSAPWLLPKNDRFYSAWERTLFRSFPARIAAARFVNWALFEWGTYGFTGTEWVKRALTRWADLHRSESVADPELLAKVTPDYEFGSKRVMITDDWYPALQRENVELVTTPIERITADGVVDTEGVERRTDTIVWATGFRSHDFVAPMEITGLDGRELNDVWGRRPEAYLGTVVSGFPNLFVLYGPNTNHGSGSVIYTLECQFNYVIDAARRIQDEGLSWIDVKPEVQAAWREEIDERSARTQWVRSGETNWYVQDGVNTNNWPGPWLEFRRRTRRIDPGDFRAQRAAVGASTLPSRQAA